MKERCRSLDDLEVSMDRLEIMPFVNSFDNDNNYDSKREDKFLPLCQNGKSPDIFFG